MKLTEKQIVDMISEEIEEMFAPGADGEEYEPDGPKPMEVLSEYKELIRLLNSEPQEYRKKQTYFQANKVLSMLLELSGYDPIMQEMLGGMPEPIASGDDAAQELRQAAVNWLTGAPGRTIKGAIAIIKQVAKQDEEEPLKVLMRDVYEAMRVARPKIMSRYSFGPDQVVRTAQGAIDQFKKDNRISEARDVPLRIDAPDETLEREVQDIIKGYKEEQVYKKLPAKEPSFEEFKEYYKQHSQVNQAVVDYAKKTMYKDAEGQLDEMPRRNPKTGEPMDREARREFSMQRPSIGRARGAYKPKGGDTNAIVQGAIANLLRDNPDVTLSVSAEDAAAIESDPSIDKAIKDRLMTPKQ